MSLSIPGLTDAELIGRGGFGSVYRCQQRALGRTVAVKVLNAVDERHSDVRQFDKECRAIGQLDWCPNIVTVFHVDVTPAGERYIIMEFAPGGSLADVLKTRGPLDEATVRRVGTGIGAALVAAHGAGVLHRDVKPANILLSRTGEPVLADFGIARLTGETATSGSISGTIAYSAPEVLNGTEATAASDVFSLGATMFSLLSGRSPFAITGQEQVATLVARALSGPPPDVASLGASPDLQRILARCLERDPAHRYPSAADFVADLARGGRGAAAPTMISTSPFDPSLTAPDRATTITSLPRYVAPPAAPPAAPPSAALPTGSHPERHLGWSRTAVVLGSLVAVLLLGGAAAGAFAFLTAADTADPSDSTAAVSRGPGTTAAPVEKAGAGESPPRDAATDDPASAPPSPAPTRKPRQPAPVATVTCWNGAAKQSTSACPPLKGQAAFEWVFPGLDFAGCRPAFGAGRTYFDCVDDTGVQYTVSRWVTSAAGRAHYTGTPGGEARSVPGDLLRWDGFDTRVKAALMYADLPWGITVYADSSAGVDDAIDALRMRPIAQVRTFS
ncbi:hypothetical protein BH11ACT8_BH11ACT8_32250 [soil metagenome]